MSQFKQGGFGDDLFGSPYILGFPVPTRGVGSARAKTGGVSVGSGTAHGTSHAAAGIAVTRSASGTIHGGSTATAVVIRRRPVAGGQAYAISTTAALAVRRRGSLAISTRGVSHGTLSGLMLVHASLAARGVSHTSGTLLKVVLPAPVSGLRIAPWSRRTPAADLRFQGWTARV